MKAHQELTQETYVIERTDKPPPDRKAPYEKPRVTFREPLEGVAAVCTPPAGKGVPLPTTCNLQVSS